MLTLLDIIALDYRPVRIETPSERFGKRNPTDIGVKLVRSVVRWHNQWRRVYEDDKGKFYVWINKRAVYFDADAQLTLFDTLITHS